MTEYTLSQLSLRNGQDKEEVWCADKGFIYDLSRSKLWRKGRHYEHWAGQDLSDEISLAPHNDNVFHKFKVVGKLKK